MEIPQIMAVMALLMVVLIFVTYDSQKKWYAVMLVVIGISYLLYKKIESRRGSK